MGLEQECVIHSFASDSSCDWRANTGCPDGMSCFPADGNGESEDGICIYSYGFLRCDSALDCPRGFFCKEDIYQNGEGIDVCWGDCPFYLSQGLLD